MPQISHYDTTDSHLRLLLQGPSGVGKTTLACQFPGAWVLDCDVNLGGPLRWLRSQNKPLPIGYDVIDRKDDGTVVPSNMRLQRLTECAVAAAKLPEVKTLVFDSGTKIADYIKDHVLRTNPTKSGAFEQSSWLHFYNTWVSLISQVTAARLHCVFIFHEKVDKDEIDGTMKVLINVQGQFRDIAGALFTDVWRAEVSGGSGINPTYKWLIRTMPDYRYNLKNSFGLPPLFEFDWNLIQSKLTPAK